MRIGMLTQWYDPETGPAALPAIFAREFVEQGHSVNVLTGWPNYPDGRLYPGYRMRLRERSGLPPLRITRVPLYTSHDRSSIGRSLNYGSFALSAMLLSRRALRGADAIWVYNSPATVALPLLTHSRYGAIPVFLHVQDLWPDSLVDSGMLPPGIKGKVITHVASSLVRIMENRSTVIGVISPSVRELLLDRNPRLDPARIIYAPNPTNESLFGTVEAGSMTAGDVVEVMYAGAIGDVQGLETLLEAACILRQREDIRFKLVGDGIARERLERQAVAQGLTSISFVGRVSQDDVPALIARADIQLVSLAAAPFLAHTTPSKISSLLAAGAPIVGQIAGDGAELLEASGAGVVATPADPTALAGAILELADLSPARRRAMGQRGRQYYVDNLSAAAAVRTITTALNNA